MKIVFVVLNYNTFQETKECILSIENKIDTQDYKIVIVDNQSKDQSADRIAEFIEEKNKIVLLRSTENLGFARGNNIGIEYANKNYRPEFIVVLNSDTELIQEDLVEKLDKEYKKSGFALLGPLILTADGRCDNSPHFPPSIDIVEEEIKKFKREEIIIKKGLYRTYYGIRFFKNLIKDKVLKKRKSIHRNMEFHEYQKQVVLQGCFIVFSAKAFNHIKGFDNRTFLYYEEAILYLNLIKCGLITVYTPEIVVYHKDGCATNTVANKSRDKLLFINKCYQESASILLAMLKER